MKWTVDPARRLVGRVVVPGDKSISHRAVLFAALARGASALDGLADGEDVASTASAMRSLGVAIDRTTDGVRVRGSGLSGLRPPAAPIDCGNSGTTLRLLAGLLAGQPFVSTLTGDLSLRRRPMHRVAAPLRCMGAEVRTAAGDTAPLTIVGAQPLRAITYRPEVASAQVKSCVLLAGLFADGRTTVFESVSTRDHSERLLAAMGADLEVRSVDGVERITVEPAPQLEPIGGRLPGDMSSASYWLAAATLLPESRLRLPGVGLNPTRAAIIEVLRDWGAQISVEPDENWCGEPLGTITIEGVGDGLSGGTIAGGLVPSLIDELPLLAALGAFTRNGVEIRGAAELRVKESDRIASTAAALRALGAEVDEFPDGLAVQGGSGLAGGVVDAAGDHRIALSVGAVGLAADAPVTILNAEAMAVSYPGFPAELEAVVRR